MSDKRCGTCYLYGPNFYSKDYLRDHGCHADAKMDLPASWSNGTPMSPTDGAACPIWETRPRIQQEQR